MFISAATGDSDLQRLLLGNFIRDRTGEARKWLSDSPDSEVRIAVWIYNQVANQLAFYHSNEIVDGATVQATFAPGEGLLGQAFLENRTWNEAKAQEIPGFKKLQDGALYSAVLCVPIGKTTGLQPLGVVTADKSEPAEFNVSAENVASARLPSHNR